MLVLELSSSSDASPADDACVARVCAELIALQGDIIVPAELSGQSRLIEDVGLDSLKFVDLTVRLERAFGIAEFPMQEWVDDQVAAGRPLTIGALARACQDQSR